MMNGRTKAIRAKYECVMPSSSQLKRRQSPFLTLAV